MKPLLNADRLMLGLIRADRPYSVSSVLSWTVPILLWVYGRCDTAKAADRNMRDAYATFSCSLCRHQRGLQSTPGDPLGVGGRVFWMEGPAKHCMGQDLDYNTVIVYFTADDLIRFPPYDPKRAEKERLCVCVCMRVPTWAWV